MSGYWTNPDGTCTGPDCSKPAEYIGVLAFGDTDTYDLCPEHFLGQALDNVQWSWYTHRAVDDDVTCSRCEKQAVTLIESSLDKEDVHVCEEHIVRVYLDNVLLATGWSAHAYRGVGPIIDGIGPAGDIRHWNLGDGDPAEVE
jgi:hypothetical protein